MLCPFLYIRSSLANENDELQPSGQESESRDAEVARLRNALRESRQQLLALRDEVDRMAEPPLSYALYLCSNNDGTVDVVTAGSGAKRDRDGFTHC